MVAVACDFERVLLGVALFIPADKCSLTKDSSHGGKGETVSQDKGDGT